MGMCLFQDMFSSMKIHFYCKILNLHVTAESFVNLSFLASPSSIPTKTDFSPPTTVLPSDTNVVHDTSLSSSSAMFVPTHGSPSDTTHTSPTVANENSPGNVAPSEFKLAHP